MPETRGEEREPYLGIALSAGGIKIQSLLSKSERIRETVRISNLTVIWED